MNECKCSECFAEPVCTDDEFPIGACCEEMRQMIRVVRKHFADADKMVNWISVKERLPKITEGWCSKEVYVTDGEFIETACLDAVPGYETEWSYTGMGPITHWCEKIPLPGPPVVQL